MFEIFDSPGFLWIGKLGKYFFGWLDLSRHFWGIRNNLKIRGSAGSSANKVQPREEQLSKANICDVRFLGRSSSLTLTKCAALRWTNKRPHDPTTATSIKRSLKNRLRILSKHFAIIPSRSVT